jgi:hypothetical protein
MIELGIRVRHTLVEFATANPALQALIITEDEWNCYGPGTRGPYAISLSSGAH